MQPGRFLLPFLDADEASGRLVTFSGSATASGCGTPSGNGAFHGCRGTRSIGPTMRQKAASAGVRGSGCLFQTPQVFLHVWCGSGQCLLGGDRPAARDQRSDEMLGVAAHPLHGQKATCSASARQGWLRGPAAASSCQTPRWSVLVAHVTGEEVLVVVRPHGSAGNHGRGRRHPVWREAARPLDPPRRERAKSGASGRDREDKGAAA